MAIPQNYSLDINVFDQNNKKISNSWVQLSNGLSGTTDLSGNIKFNNLSNGTLEINATALYYFDNSGKVTINGPNAILTITLNNTMDRFDNFTQYWGMFENIHAPISGDSGYVSSSWDNLGAGNYGLNISWNNSVYQKRSYRLKTQTNTSFINTVGYKFKIPSINRSIIMNWEYSHSGNPDNLIFKFNPVGNDELWQFTGGNTHISTKIPRLPRDVFITSNITSNMNKAGCQEYDIEINGYGYSTGCYSLATSNPVNYLQIDIYAVWNNTYILFDYFTGSNHNLNITLPTPRAIPLSYTLPTARPAWSEVFYTTWEAGQTAYNNTITKNISKIGMSLKYDSADSTIDWTYTQLDNTLAPYDQYLVVPYFNGFHHSTNTSRQFGTGIIGQMNQSERVRLVQQMSNISLGFPKFKGIIWDEAYGQSGASLSNLQELWAARANPNFELIYYGTYFDSHVSIIKSYNSLYEEQIPKLNPPYTAVGHYPRAPYYNNSFLYENIVNNYYDLGSKVLTGYYVGGTTTTGGTYQRTRDNFNAIMTAEAEGYGKGANLYLYFGQLATPNGTGTTDSLNWYKSLHSEGTVEGHANHENQTSIAGANISLYFANGTFYSSTISDNDGKFNFSNMNSNTYYYINITKPFFIPNQSPLFMITSDSSLNIGSIYLIYYDIDGNKELNILDLSLIGQHFGENLTRPYPIYDVNGDGVVDIVDIAIVASYI